jgi:BRCA1-associated protein
MTAYFFHVKLELYPSAHPSTASQPVTNDVFRPESTTDIFKTDFPAHRTSKTISHSSRTHHSPRSSLDSRPAAASRPASAHSDALLLPERNVALKDTASPTILPKKASSEIATRDWRYGPVTIESIDMEPASTKLPPTGLHTKAAYVPSTPKATDVGWGVVHLYRDSQETAALGHTHVKDDSDFDPQQCTTLCILAVPSWMMPSDLLGFVGDQAREDVSHFRLIRTGRANKYMVLMKFRQAKKAREWQKLWNGKLFSAMEVRSPEHLQECAPCADPVIARKLPCRLHQVGRVPDSRVRCIRPRCLPSKHTGPLHQGFKLAIRQAACTADPIPCRAAHMPGMP